MLWTIPHRLVYYRWTRWSEPPEPNPHRVGRGLWVVDVVTSVIEKKKRRPVGGFNILGGSSHLVSRLFHPSCKWINPTYPTYNWGYNLLTEWDNPPSSPRKQYEFMNWDDESRTWSKPPTRKVGVVAKTKIFHRKGLLNHPTVNVSNRIWPINATKWAPRSIFKLGYSSNKYGLWYL